MFFRRRLKKLAGDDVAFTPADYRHAFNVLSGVGGSISGISIIFLSVLVAFARLDDALFLAVTALAVVIPLSALSVYLGLAAGVDSANISAETVGVVLTSCVAPSMVALSIAIGAVFWHLDPRFEAVYIASIVACGFIYRRFRKAQDQQKTKDSKPSNNLT